MSANRTWLYCRAASRENSMNALRTQKQRLECYAKKHGLEIIGGSSDIGNGLTLDRTGLLEFHTAMERGDVDILLLVNLSRLGRDLDDVFQYWALLREHGVCICTVGGEVNLETHPIFRGGCI